MKPFKFNVGDKVKIDTVADNLTNNLDIRGERDEYCDVTLDPFDEAFIRYAQGNLIFTIKSFDYCDSIFGSKRATYQLNEMPGLFFEEDLEYWEN